MKAVGISRRAERNGGRLPRRKIVREILPALPARDPLSSPNRHLVVTQLKLCDECARDMLTA
jgi:hypothetical protein